MPGIRVFFFIIMFFPAYPLYCVVESILGDPEVFMSIGFTEILLILFVVLILFGAKRLPELARSIGKSVSEFKKGMNDIKAGIEEPANTEKTVQEPTAEEKP